MRRSQPQASGFSLVEVTLAMGIVVFCLVAMMGLLTVGLTSNQAAVSQSAASSILSAVIADLRATPLTTPPGKAAKSVQFGISIPANTVTTAQTPVVLYFTPDGQSSATPGAQYVYRLTLTFLSNGTAASSRTATFADLMITWPSAAVPPNVLGSVETFAALDRN
jgi:uncharacterized protein (TIGR02598 family)